ncbi:hypothetical protein LINPERHAP2_LOCUS23822 [Linum perenne]
MTTTTTSTSNVIDWFPDDIWSNSTNVKDVEIMEKKTDNTFPPMDLEFLEFRSLLQNAKDEKGILWVETSASERTDGGSGRNGDGGTDTEEAAADGEVPSSENSSSEPELVEKYISQMHDLSFMMENDLSMPRR